MSAPHSERYPTLSEAHELRVKAIRTRFGEALQAGGRPRIEAFLDENDDVPSLPILKELLRLEIGWRLQQYETFSTDDYLARFPQIDRKWLVTLVNPCPSSEQLSQFLAEEVSGSTRDGMAHHINACAECLETLKSLGNCGNPAPLGRPPAESPPKKYDSLEIFLERLSAEPLPKPNALMPSDAPPLTIIGRYRVVKILGEGGFGKVYLAHDDQLDRRVAIKVPHPNRIAQPDDFEQFLAEARILASFDHPHIVPVHDTGRTDDGLCYVVSKLIPGSDLASKIKESSTSFTEAAELVATVAEALHYAHRKGVVHRDVKPANILLDATGTPFVADFGLALKDQDFGKGAGFAGTPNYMSPEQARGEGHRVDGRSDIFSLGVVFYELLTGRRPFRGETPMALLQDIVSGESRPPRQLNDSIPNELERICLKALAKRVSERYTTAQDLAVDLRHFLEHAPVIEKSAARAARSVDVRPAPPSTPIAATTEPQPLKIIPKGLRAFDAHDADFFLELLPGPRDRAGLPDTIRFWKTRIEESDPDQSFAVGLIYGPSGCGKSSLVKAGLLPRLGAEVIVVYVEATAAETETRLLNGLRKRCPTLPTDLALKETLAALRRRQGMPPDKKVLLVLDQFEQWLHVQNDPENTELVQALRQCDSGRVQCVVMVRDDFWMAVTRFMRALEVRLVEGQNSAVVDLFDLEHAQKVLAGLGRAFGKLPQSGEAMSKNNRDFLAQAVSGLAQEGKVICVRLALFAEMMKGKSWTTATLKAVGGAEGVGLNFLEETFSSVTAPPEHRYHQKAARTVLKALLPESGANIKGHMRTHAELLAASGYAGRPSDFEELIHILDSETRLITPTDPEGKDEVERTKDEQAGPSDSSAIRQPSSLRYYQLTHDYLVQSLRDWLTHKQRETRRGRAELLLADRASLWNARPEKRELPSLSQWLRIHWRTQRTHWTSPERKMMRVANRYHLVRGLTAASILVLLAVLCWEGFGRLKAQTYRDRLLVAGTADVPAIVADLAPYRRWADPLLKEAYVQADANRELRKQLHLSLSLLPVDPDQATYLYERLLKAEPEELIVIREALLPQREIQLGRLWKVLEDREKDEESRFRAACALATFDPANPRWQNVSREVAAKLVTQNPLVVAKWADVLRPVCEWLLPPLASFLEDETRGGSELWLIATVYGNYAVSRPSAIATLEQGLTIENEPNASAETKIALAKRQANIGAALTVMGRPEKVWPLLEYNSDPTLRSFLIDRFVLCNVDAQVLTARMKLEPDASIRQALLLSLAEFDLDRLPIGERKDLLARLTKLYVDDPDSGIHAAAEALMRKWLAGEKLPEMDKELATRKTERGWMWYVDGQGHTMLIAPAPGDIWVGEANSRHRRPISQNFAIASKEVTLEQFRRFRPKHVSAIKFSPTKDCPVGSVTWYEAADYCNWLSEQERIPKEQWCYLPNPDGVYAAGMKVAPEYLRLTGYRLPTEAEWEHACRAGSTTQWSHGDAEELIDKYAWCNTNSFEKSHPVGGLKPNRLGLFDTHGNAWEWCQDTYVENPTDDGLEVNGDLVGIRAAYPRVLRGGSYLLRRATARSAFRHHFLPSDRHEYVGFRPAKTLAEY